MSAVLKSKKALTLSIIIPAYNEARHIAACLDAIALQTVKPDEVIVVDNNSHDETTVISEKYSFVTVLHEEQQGVVWARNRGFNAASSDIIARIDADSIVPSNWVEYIKNFYSNPEHDECALTGRSYFYNIRFGRLAGWVTGQIAFRINRLLLGHYITYGSNMALPSKMWRAIEPNTCRDKDIHEDLDLAIHLHRVDYGITYHQDFLVGVNMRRVKSNHKELWGNLMWWPRTLRRHNKHTWIFGWIGALLLYLGSPIVPIFEWIARRFGMKPLED